MRIVIVLDCRQPERLAGFWAQVLGYRPAPSGGPYIVLVPDAQPGRDLVLQRVPEPKAGRTACTWTFASPPSNPSSRECRGRRSSSSLRAKQQLRGAARNSERRPGRTWRVTGKALGLPALDEAP